MSKKRSNFRKKDKDKNKNKFMYTLIGVGVLLIALSIYEKANEKVDVNAKKLSGNGSTREVKSFQPTDSGKDVPGRLLWGRDF